MAGHTHRLHRRWAPIAFARHLRGHRREHLIAFARLPACTPPADGAVPGLRHRQARRPRCHPGLHGSDGRAGHPAVADHRLRDRQRALHPARFPDPPGVGRAGGFQPGHRFHLPPQRRRPDPADHVPEEPGAGRWIPAAGLHRGRALQH
ncbi:hypothetical protein G6F57_022418 [Rhizopus arrhizus]|nr:hypothetical protein G6F24_014799 [Rhizopus arrhizus]KAG1270733.1 hypothetical protein G6F65_012905 [Rhizopus arrhizus]KAG1383538.1 hypothetical protein G6F59_017789 [Rhizopus arrhizus]KAG1433100.1 hypothetical protein G6F57_022418 [Rhizopus arrhizus]